MTCLANTWTKVATNVTTGNIYNEDRSTAKFYQAYVATGGAAPTDETEGVKAFYNTNREEIESGSAIDVYLYCHGENGFVRVDV